MTINDATLGKITIDFGGPGKPPAGNYTLGGLPFGALQCAFAYSPTTSSFYGATSDGSIVVSVSGSNTICTFNNVICPGTAPTTYTISGVIAF